MMKDEIKTLDSEINQTLIKRSELWETDEKTQWAKKLKLQDKAFGESKNYEK